MDLTKMLTSETFSLCNIGSWASIAGLGLTILIFINIRSIKQFYMFSARVPELLKKFVQHITQIAAFQKNYPSSREELMIDLAGAEMVLKSIQPKVNGKVKKSIKEIIKTMPKADDANIDKEDIWKFYIRAQKLIVEIQELQSDLKWER